MFLDQTYSEIGRSTSQHLNALRKQLGVGCDPAFDYTEMTNSHKKVGTKEKDKKRPVDDENAGPVEQLRRALRDVVGGPAAEIPDEEAAGASPSGPSMSKLRPEEVKRNREEKRNTSAFKAPTRNQLQKLDLVNRFRAPPIGTYRPKDHLLGSSPKIQCMDFKIRDPTRSRTKLKVEEEIDRLKEEGLPHEHLSKWGTVSQDMEGFPSPAERRKRDISLSKQLPRPDMVKQAGIVFNNNSFTAGVLDGDLITSHLRRQPKWDFAKGSTAVAKDREYYFQPGQYKPNLDAVRPKLGGANIPWEQRQGRRDLTEGNERAGDHLPDRSLSRSCPIQTRYGMLKERHQKTYDFNKYTVRPQLIKIKNTTYHDVDDPETDSVVLNRQMTFDATAASKCMSPKLLEVEKFEESLNRMAHVKAMKSYGQDITLVLAKDNLSRGPRSTELLSDNFDKKPSLRPRIQVRNMKHMDGREKEHRYTLAPARNKEGAAKFERGTREGDARAETHAFSDLASGITKLRAGRVYDGLEPDRAVQTSQSAPTL